MTNQPPATTTTQIAPTDELNALRRNLDRFAWLLAEGVLILKEDNPSAADWFAQAEADLTVIHDQGLCADLPLENDAAVAAIEFALKDDDGLIFLRLWHGGEFDVIRAEWENVPDEVFIGADPLFQPTVDVPERAAAYPQVRMVLAHKHTCANVQPGSTSTDACDCGAMTDGKPVEVEPSAPVYQLRNNVLATNWRDADKAAYDSVGDNPSYERRVLYTHPAEQPVLASDQWPKLEKPALVGAGRFSIGLSARLVVEAAQRHYEYETTQENETLRIATGENFLALLAQLEQLRGLRPAVPPRPPEGNGLPRYGLRWNGPQQPLATPMDDGYWTPWHLANELLKDAERYQWLRSRDLETISHGGVFAGLTPQNMVLNKETLDEAVDAAMAKEVQP
ncbi:MAG: hypothetical protein K0M54_22925 [Pseudomonas sp.]|uniref:hypothetical protein n=1 Tax=Pseudomonas sp. TaxID=306 RepID=UPI0025E71E90|nr:hypothetical protein [Pseudomonas sp.]MBW8356677.1 hypothetical protein [Pseudomonas sp.]